MAPTSGTGPAAWSMTRKLGLLQPSLTLWMPHMDLHPYHDRYAGRAVGLVVRCVPLLTAIDRPVAAPWQPQRHCRPDTVASGPPHPRGRSYPGSRSRRRTARRVWPSWSSARSNSTRWPGFNSDRPLSCNARKWTKTSWPPSTAMNPCLRRRADLHGPHQHSLEPVARQGAGLRLGHYLLAPPRRVGPRRGLRTTPSAAVGRARRGRPGRLGAGECGLLQPAGGQRGDLTGANPVDRGKRGSKLHLAGEAGGLPLAVILSAANANDSTMLEAVLEDIPPIRMPTGRRRGGLARSMPTKCMTIGAAGRICGGGASAHGSPDVAWSPPPGLAATAGRSSGPGRGLAASGGCGSAMRVLVSASMHWRC